MVWIAQNGQRCLIFIVISLRLANIKERWKKKLKRDGKSSCLFFVILCIEFQLKPIVFK